MESERLRSLAAVGLATRTASPSLLHAIRGSLHDITMLAALLEPRPGTGTPDPKVEQRLRSVERQLHLLERNVALLGAMTEWPTSDVDSVCASSAALPDVMRLLKDEAARRRLRFEYDFSALPAQLGAEERALQHVLLACGTWAAQHAGDRAALHVHGRDEGGEAIFDFTAPGGMTASDATAVEDLRLLAGLVQAAGGRLSSDPGLSVAFRRAPDAAQR